MLWHLSELELVSGCTCQYMAVVTCIPMWKMQFVVCVLGDIANPLNWNPGIYTECVRSGIQLQVDPGS